MKRLALAAGVTFALSGTALAADTSYHTGTYTGSTSQSHTIAMKVSSGKMDKMTYMANFDCTDKQGKKTTLSNHVTQLGKASIDKDQVSATYKLDGGSDHVHLNVTLNKAKATGDFTESLSISEGGHKYQCVTPGGHAGKAGKVSFTMTWTGS